MTPSPGGTPEANWEGTASRSALQKTSVIIWKAQVKSEGRSAGNVAASGLAQRVPAVAGGEEPQERRMLMQARCRLDASSTQSGQCPLAPHFTHQSLFPSPVEISSAHLLSSPSLSPSPFLDAMKLQCVVRRAMLAGSTALADSRALFPPFGLPHSAP